MSPTLEVKCDVPTEEVFGRLLDEPLRVGLATAGVRREFYRDLYLDTVDRALEGRGVTCRLRIRADDRRFLCIRIQQSRGAGVVPTSDERYEAEVDGIETDVVLNGHSEPARRLRAFIAPDRLVPRLEIEVERYRRGVTGGWLKRTAFELLCDIATVRDASRSDVFRELKIRRVGRSGAVSFDRFVASMQEQFALRTILTYKRDRAEKKLRAAESDRLSNEVRASRATTVLAIDQGCLAIAFDDKRMVLPSVAGTGEAACREWLRSHLGSDVGQVRLLGTAPASGQHPVLDVWLAEGLSGRRRDASGGGRIEWVPLDEIMPRVGSPVLRDPETLAALTVAARSQLLPERRSGEFETAARRGAAEIGKESLAGLQRPALPETSLNADNPVPDQFVNEQLSWLEFNARVLELAEDPGTPLLARMMFLAVFSSNLDEFFMVRVAILKHAIAGGVTKRGVDGLTPQEELDAIMIRMHPLLERQQRCFRHGLPELARYDIRILRWSELSPDQRQEMTRFFERQLFPALTPHAMTQAPGHPFPHLANLSLSLAVTVRDARAGPVHFAHIRVPQGVPRFVPLSGGSAFVPIEDVLRSGVGTLFPGRVVEEAFAFRVTRSGDITVDEEGAASLLRAVEAEVKRRPFGSVVRIEVEQHMPQVMRDLLQRELSFEEAKTPSTLSSADIFEAKELISLGDAMELAELPRPDLQYPSFEPRAALDPDRSIFDQIRERDRLLHHPYDDFDATVQRFFAEAALDPNVLAIKLTLYRSGSRSGIVDALMRAADAGKDVSVFIELKARFDEERNISWARKLERAGIHVVTGFVRLKTHAKVALVVRREGDTVRQYVHVGTGNYNAATAKRYTDLGMLSCREDLGADLNDLFNEVTGTSAPPLREFRQLMVAPKHLLPNLLRLIDRECEHARAGRAGRIRIKLNGIADTEMIGALYRASQAGVEIDLIVRGICSLRPGVPGLSERIRVYSILGRFLEHARILHFGNGGADEYFIGSADWRPRNLRRRVEVMTPVLDPDARGKLDGILEAELDDPTAWLMGADGAYGKRPQAVGVEPFSVQEQFARRLRVDAAGGA